MLIISDQGLKSVVVAVLALDYTAAFIVCRGHARSFLLSRTVGGEKSFENCYLSIRFADRDKNGYCRNKVHDGFACNCTSCQRGNGFWCWNWLEPNPKVNRAQRSRRTRWISLLK